MTTAERSLAGRHALVTGANRGIGAAIAAALSAAGASVSLMVRDAAAARTVADSLAGPHAIVVADVTDQSASVAACTAAVKAFGPVDILVNNAGSAESAPFLKSDGDLFARMFAVHVLGAVYTSQAVLPSMIERGHGHIVNVASVAGLWGAPYITAYGAAKHAMVGLTRSLAAEVHPRGIAVNAVCPGFTETDMVQRAVERIVAKTGRSADEARASILSDAKQSRMVSAGEVADAVLALCLVDARAPSGQTVVIDGSGTGSSTGSST